MSLRTRKGAHYIHAAAKVGSVSIIEYLLRSNTASKIKSASGIKGAHYYKLIDLPELKHGNTPLHYAARSGQVDVVRLLVDPEGFLSNREANGEGKEELKREKSRRQIEPADIYAANYEKGTPFMVYPTQ